MKIIKHKKLTLILAIILLIALSCIPKNYTKENKTLHIKYISEQKDSNPLYREFRAAWFSTVANIDWPLSGANEEEQKMMIISHLDKVKEHNFNALFVQVKPDAGTIYPSKMHPTTRYFYGFASSNETDNYPFQTDMLEFIIEEAHKRNIEIHAWFNPYRISLTHDTNKSYEEQYAKKNFVHTYISNGYEPIHWVDGRLYLDPGVPLATEYVINSVVEVLENYDVDGIHFDDYFYQNGRGKTTFMNWPDEKSAQKYGKKSGYKIDDKSKDNYGKNGLFAWRRSNINNLVSTIYKEIKKRKPYVKWTISPAGVWRNKNEVVDYISADENGSDTKAGNPNFDTLHADVLLWLLNGEKTKTLKNATKNDGLGKMYIDALIPQVYWSRYHKLAPFDVLVDWWVSQAKMGKKNKTADIYIGHALYRMGFKNNVEPWDDTNMMKEQVNYIRENGENLIKGSSFFTLHNMYYNDRDTKDFGAEAMNNLVRSEYLFEAIIPKMNTMKHLEKNIDSVYGLYISDIDGKAVISWEDSSAYITDKYGHPKEGTTTYYSIYRKDKENEEIKIIGKLRRDKNETTNIFVDSTTEPNKSYIYYITALDRLHSESKATVLEFINF